MKLNSIFAAASVLALIASTNAFAAPKRAAVSIKEIASPAAISFPTLTLWDPLHLFTPGSVAAPGASPIGTTTSASSVTNPISVLQAFTVADLSAALADAQAFKIATAGVGYAVGDTLLLGDKITTLTVASVLNGGITSIVTTVSGPVALGQAAPGPVSPLSTSGAGSGATFVQNDPTAAACYTALLPIVQTTLQNPLPTQLGGFIAFQKLRDLTSNVQAIQANLQNGPLNMACAPVVLSTMNTINMLGAAVGVNLALKAPAL